MLPVPGTEVLLVTPRCENRHVSRNRFLVQKYTAVGHIKFIIQTTQVRDDEMRHVQEILLFSDATAIMLKDHHSELGTICI